MRITSIPQNFCCIKIYIRYMRNSFCDSMWQVRYATIPIITKGFLALSTPIKIRSVMIEREFQSLCTHESFQPESRILWNFSFENQQNLYRIKLSALSKLNLTLQIIWGKHWHKIMIQIWENLASFGQSKIVEFNLFQRFGNETTFTSTYVSYTFTTMALLNKTSRRICFLIYKLTTTHPR